MHVGTITKLYHDKEYGRITTRQGQEAHFHKQCLWDTPFEALRTGQDVEFELQTAHNGFVAFHIRPCAEQPPSLEPSEDQNA